jgi:hypothetical protein
MMSTMKAGALGGTILRQADQRWERLNGETG